MNFYTFYNNANSGMLILHQQKNVLRLGECLQSTPRLPLMGLLNKWCLLLAHCNIYPDWNLNSGALDLMGLFNVLDLLAHVRLLESLMI